MKSDASASTLSAAAPQRTAGRHWESTCAKMYQYIFAISIQLEGSPQAEVFSVTFQKFILVHVNWDIVVEVSEAHPFCDLLCLTLQPLSLSNSPCALGLS